jgi:hypothetical protein
MTKLTVHLLVEEYQRLEKAAEQAGTSVQGLVHNWIAQLPEVEEPFDITQDPIYLMDGWEFDAPSEFSVNVDKYLYGEDQVR